jgi:hypothetical protein
MESPASEQPVILDHEPGIARPSRDPFVSLKRGGRGVRADLQPEAYSIWENQGKPPVRPAPPENQAASAGG